MAIKSITSKRQSNGFKKICGNSFTRFLTHKPKLLCLSSASVVLSEVAAVRLRLGYAVIPRYVKWQPRLDFVFHKISLDSGRWLARYPELKDKPHRTVEQALAEIKKRKA